MPALWDTFSRWLGYDGETPETLDRLPEGTGRGRRGIAAPKEWGDGSQLARLAWQEIFGISDLAGFTVTRDQAMGIPSLKRGRDILSATIGRQPLVVYRVDTPVDPQPAWCATTDGSSSPFHRMAWTVDDLLFYGDSLWQGPRGSDGYFLRLTRVPYLRWTVAEDTGDFLVDDQPVDQDTLVYIPSFNEGILAVSQTALRTAAALAVQADDAARTPFKLELHQTTADVMTDQEIDDLIAKARGALASNRGILWTNAAVEARVHPVDAQQLLIEGRNASAVDMARIASLPASLVDATAAGASLTYETTQGRNQQALDYGLAAYMAAVTSRLSMDDVVPHGQRVGFDLTGFTALLPDPTGPATSD